MDLDEETLENLGWGTDLAYEAAAKKLTKDVDRFARLRLMDEDKVLRKVKNKRYNDKIKRDPSRYAILLMQKRVNKKKYVLKLKEEARKKIRATAKRVYDKMRADPVRWAEHLKQKVQRRAAKRAAKDTTTSKE
jgi:hypothetical protein